MTIKTDSILDKPVWMPMDVWNKADIGQIIYHFNHQYEKSCDDIDEDDIEWGKKILKV